MAIIADKPVAAGGPQAGGREALAIALFLLASALFLFLDTRTTPVVLWDESRNVVNALEMKRGGLSLVTTYGFAPDLWNTKPPLLIWLMSASASLFGPSEWTLRLPSALASLGTLLIVILFVRRAAGSLATGLIAATILLLSPGFFGEHGARTADYDALLLFFTTLYLQLLFFAVHRPRPALVLLAAAGAAIACACLTKSVAGLVPGAGLALYLLATGRWRRILRNRSGYGLMTALAVAPVLGFYLARDAAMPGYLAAAFRNDVIGRVRESLVGREAGPLFYASELVAGWFFAGPLLIGAPLAFRLLRGKARTLFLYSLAAAAAPLLVYSFATTKLIHYVLPAFPWLAVLVALALRAFWRRCFAAAPGERPRVTATGALLLLAAAALLAWLGWRSADWRYRAFPEREYYTQALYGELFASLSRHRVARVTIVDPGFTLEGKPHYTPMLRSYRLMWSERGLETEERAELPLVPAGVLASCDPGTTARLVRLGPDIAGVRGCAAIRPGAPIHPS